MALTYCLDTNCCIIFPSKNVSLINRESSYALIITFNPQPKPDRLRWALNINVVISKRGYGIRDEFPLDYDLVLNDFIKANCQKCNIQRQFAANSILTGNCRNSSLVLNGSNDGTGKEYNQYDNKTLYYNYLHRS